MNTVRDIEAAMAAPGADLDALEDALFAIIEQFRILKFGAAAALTHDSDLRPALARYVRGHAELNGRPVAEQIAAFAREGDVLFGELSIRAWGIAL